MLRVNIEAGGDHSLTQIDEIVIVNVGEEEQELAVPYRVYRSGVPTPLTVFHNRQDGALALVLAALEGLVEEEEGAGLEGADRIRMLLQRDGIYRTLSGRHGTGIVERHYENLIGPGEVGRAGIRSEQPSGLAEWEEEE